MARMPAPAPLDLLHQGERVIGIYLLETEDGPALFDCGPTSCLPTLKRRLADRGLALTDLRHLLLSHIHLDHAGAAGVLVREHPGLQVHVSEVGAPHLVDPSRLERSARRLYGWSFDALWGELAPVPGASVHAVGDRVLGLDCFPSPGHASHHVCYVDADGTLYAGDAAGVRIAPGRHVLPVSPPPDVDVEGWHRTFDEILARRPARLALVHFGVFDDVEEHVAQSRERLDLWAARVGGGMDVRRRRARRPRGRRGRGCPVLRARRAVLAVVRGARALLGDAPTGPGMNLRETLGPLSERPFRLLFGARTASMLGSTFAPVALAFAILDDLDGTATQLGLVLAATWVPQIFFILVGGVWADRLPRNLVMVTTDIVMFAAQATVAVLLLTGAAELWHLAATQLVRGIANAFFFPAAQGVVPQVVTEHRLQNANALLRLSHSSVGILGAAGAGVAVALVGSGWAIALDAVTFLVSAAFLVRLRLPRRVAAEAPSFLRELREGWSEFASRRWLWGIVVQFLFINAFAHNAFVVLGPVMAKEFLGGASAWGLILSAEAAGMVLGGLLILRFRPRRMLLVATLAIFLMVPMYVLLAEAAPVPLIMAGGLLAGISVEVFGVLWETSLQQQIPRDRLSRVSSYDALGSFVAIPIGLSLVGPISEALGTETTLLGAAAIVVVPTALVLLIREVRTLERTDPSFRPLLEPDPAIEPA
jgi:glyoxylase-like metal-dependent hydrolase (beta-lactamase superfamily II)/MFS family permease